MKANVLVMPICNSSAISNNGTQSLVFFSFFFTALICRFSVSYPSIVSSFLVREKEGGLGDRSGAREKISLVSRGANRGVDFAPLIV